MIRASPEEANALLTDWKNRGIWIGVACFLRPDGSEEHKFWGRIETISGKRVMLAGEHARLVIPLDGAVFEYSEVSEVPQELASRFSEFDFVFTIRSQTVLAFLFGAGPKNE